MLTALYVKYNVIRTTGTPHAMPYTPDVAKEAAIDLTQANRSTASSRLDWLPYATIALLLVVLYYRVALKLVYDWYTIPDYSHGFLVPSQGGPFVDSTLTGSYAFRLGGTDAAGTAGQREDFLGQLTSSGSGTGLAGTLDLNDFGATPPTVLLRLEQAIEEAFA